MNTTYYIVPAFSDQAGQCRVVMREGSHQARDSYRANPDNWREVGLMSSLGRLRCIDAPAAIADDLRDNEPLMAGTQFEYTPDGAPAP